MNGQRFWLAALLFLLLEAALIGWIDLPLSLNLRQAELTQPGLFQFFHTITDAGKSVWYLWPLACVALGCGGALRLPRLSAPICQRLARAGRRAAFAFLCIAASGLLTDTIKPLVGRARPVEYLREGLYGFRPLTFHAAWNGMPSGHATTAFTLCALLTLWWPRGRAVWLALAVLLAASRVMVNAHYLADVLAGAVVGLATVRAFQPQRMQNGMEPILQGLFPIDRPRRVF